MPKKFKIQDGDVCGPHGIILYKRLEKDAKGKYLGEFICPLCGKHFINRLDNISRGDAKSCGCLLQKRNKEFGQLNHKNLLGQKFGKLTVIEKTDKRKDGRVIWKCQCDCGHIVEVTSHNLLNGNTQSCGCLRKDIGKKYQRDLTGQTFGYLKVIKNTGKSYKKGNQTHTVWLCECLRDGNLVEIRSDSLLHKGVSSCGCLNSLYNEKIKQILKDNNLTFIPEKTFSDCINPKTNAKLRFDFYLPDYNCCIEYDGEQHFKGWYNSVDSLQNIQYRDNIKNKYCKENGILLIRIPYWDKDKISIDYILEKIG